MQNRGFLDKVLQFMGIQEEAVEEQEKPSEAETGHRNGSAPVAAASDAKKRPRLVSLPGPGRSPNQMKVSVVYPKSYEEVQAIADNLKERQPVIVSLGGVDTALSRRMIDFLSGVTYALEGQIHRIGEEIFLFAPINVVIDAEAAFGWSEEEFFER